MLLGLGLSDVVRPCTLQHRVAAHAGNRGNGAELTADRPSKTRRLYETTAVKTALIRPILPAAACVVALKVGMIAHSEYMICKA